MSSEAEEEEMRIVQEELQRLEVAFKQAAVYV